jgi:hypothetical protein
METRNYVTDLPNQINKQIQQNTQKYDVNTGGVREVLNEGVNPIPLTELGSTFDQMVAPSAPSIRYSKAYIEGKPAITLVIDFSGRDELGLEINDDIRCDIFRDENNDGLFSDDECLQQLDLRKVNNYTDKTAPANKIVRYRCLVKNMRNGLQQWSQPLVINTADTVTPYTPVSPLSITNGASTIDEKNNTVTTMLKIEKHVSEYLKHMELYYKQKDQAEWSQAIILDEKTATKEEVVEGVTVDYYIYYLSGLSRGQIYSVKVKAIMKTGVKSEYSSPHDFIAGDFVAPAPPREVKAVSICDTTALKVETTWKAALELYDAKDVVKYQLYRLRWVPAAGAFSDMPELVTEITIDQSIEKELYTYTHTLDSADENKWYVYMVRSVDSFNNTSAFIYSQLIQAIVEVDSANIWVKWTSDPEEAHNFPMRIIWKYTISGMGYGQSYGVDFIRNTDNSILASFRVADDASKRITYEGETGCTYLDLTIDMFNEEAVKEFLAIPNWQTSDNYGVRITASLFNIGGQYSTKAISNYDGQETFLINPRPLAVTGFTAAYSNVDHQVKFKWNKNTFSSLTGYVLKQITGSDYTNLMAHQADTAEDRTIRLAVWNSGTIIADDKVLKKDVTTYNYKLTEAINPVAASEIFFLIKPVGNFLNTEKYSDLNTRKIYSDEAADASTMLSSILPAPENYSALHYNTEMKVDWTHEYEFRNDENEIIYPEIAKGKLKEFVVYMSTTASDLAVDIPEDKYKVYSGVKSVTVFSDYLNPANPTTRLNIQRGVTYYFKIIPFDAYGYRGTSTPVFASTSLAVPSNLPQPRIIGASKPRMVSLPFGDVSWAQSGTISVDVYNNRNFQVEVGDALSGTFVKDRNVDRIKFYWLINKTFTYISGMDLLLPLSSNEISQQITMKSVRKSFALPTDKTIFRIVAVQARGDVEEGSLTQALPTNYSIIDTQAPSLDITKVVYASDGTNAINKNNYVNKKILTSGIDIYFNAYEKEPNSQIQKVEYSLTEGSWTTATLADGKFNVTNAQIGADTDSNSKYRDIQILVRAYDNADNTCDRVIVFRKDTVGPSASDLPTGLTWAFGKTLKLSWTNPEKQDRNLFDGLRLFVGDVLNEAKEYSLDSSPFELIPDGAVIAGKTVYLFLAATDIADNLTYLDKSGAIQPNQNSPTAIEIINVPPAAPVDVLVESQVGGVNVNWPSVTTDEDGNAEEVKKYVVEYSLAESSPAIWVSPTVDETYTTNINISLSATELDQFTANTALRLYVRVKAVDYWGAESQWSIYTNSYARPKNITAVDMGNNIFKFNLTSDMTLTPYVGAVQTGTKEHILDANYLDSEYVSFTINNTTNNYLKIDLNKVEWISDIKLKFKHSTSNVRFVFKIEEVTASGTQDVWLQSASASNHDFSKIGEIVISSSKPDANRYFEYSTTDSGVGDIALFHYENFTTKKAILAKSISIYFYSANSTAISMVEFQPVITSIANIFYGSEINLDNLVSIRSKEDASNYAALDKTGLYLYKSGVNIFTANTSGVYVRNATSSARTELNSTGVVVYNASNAEVSKIGFLDTNIYGAWLPKCYIGGTAYNNAPLQIDNAGVMTINSIANSTTGTINVTQTNAGSSWNSITKCFGATTYACWSAGYYCESVVENIEQHRGFYHKNIISGDRTTVTIGFSKKTKVQSTSLNSNHLLMDATEIYSGESLLDTLSFGILCGNNNKFYKIYSSYDLEIYSYHNITIKTVHGATYLNSATYINGALIGYKYISNTSYYQQEQATPQIILKNTTAYNAQSSTSGCTSIDFWNKYTSGGASALQAQIVSWRYNYTLPPYDQSAWTRLTFRILDYTGEWREPLTVSYSGISTPGNVGGYSVIGTYVYADTQLYFGGTYPEALGFSSAAYNGGGYGRLRFSGYVDFSYTTNIFSSISGGKVNATNADYKGYLKLNTTYSSSYVEMCRIFIAEDGKISIGSSAGALATTNTTAAGASAALSVVSVADPSLSDALYVSGYYYGVYAVAAQYNAVCGIGNSVSYPAIQGIHQSAGIGVRGDSSGTAIYGESSGAGNGVQGVANSGYGGVFSGATALYTSGPVMFTNLSAPGTGTVLVIDGSGRVKPQSSSSIRYKEILSYVEDFSMFKYNQLTPYKFRFKESGDLDIGFIAEWILPIFPDLVNFNQYGQPESLKYDRFCVYNILATQEHDRIIKEQQNEIIALKNEISEIKNLLQTLLQ